MLSWALVVRPHEPLFQLALYQKKKQLKGAFVTFELRYNKSVPGAHTWPEAKRAHLDRGARVLFLHPFLAIHFIFSRFKERPLFIFTFYFVQLVYLSQCPRMKSTRCLDERPYFSSATPKGRLIAAMKARAVAPASSI